jgi:signal transduction histidine kinase
VCGNSKWLIHVGVIRNRSSYISELLDKHGEYRAIGNSGRQINLALEIYQRNLGENELYTYLIWLYTNSFESVIPVLRVSNDTHRLYPLLRLFHFAVKRDHLQPGRANRQSDHEELIEYLIRYILDEFNKIVLQTLLNNDQRHRSAFAADMRHELEYLYGMNTK